MQKGGAKYAYLDEVVVWIFLARHANQLVKVESHQHKDVRPRRCTFTNS